MPLEQFTVTDEELLKELNSMLPQSEGISPLVEAPTNYVDLSTGSGSVASSVYSQDMYFSNGVVGTPYIKINSNHKYVRLKTTDIKKASLLAGNKINYTIYMYDAVDEKWIMDSETGVDCTAALGSKTQVVTGVYLYIYYRVNPYSDINSLTANIWTTPL